MKSFNEDIEIDFNEKYHTYKHNGTQLTCFSTWVKQYYKPFDSNLIAGIMSKKHDVPKEDILGMWKSNGILSANLGNLVEEAVQHYELHAHTGWELGEDKAMPKHPILNKVIKKYLALEFSDCEKIPQALITDVSTKKAGTADILLVVDWDKKICRLADYKANIEADKIDSNMKPLAPFAHLPANKLTKYQIQMSFYAHLLEKHGWTVEGLDALVYEDTWKVYPLEVLRGKWFDDAMGFVDPLSSFAG